MPSHPLHHVAIATPSIREAAPLLELLTGETCSPVEEVAAQGVRVAFVGTLELIEPMDPEGGVARFLKRRGPGLHHVAFSVPDVAAALADARARGLRLIDEAPRAGAGGHRVAFLHPESTGGVLWELVEEE
ncbi:MAG: methylmalonyl-CoA epimerase [Gemmatimonadales bacterium]|nr:MAG: methylmalonyl-CoA epimerase [Gemmatimonadales bacterium]